MLKSNPAFKETVASVLAGFQSIVGW